MTGEDAIDADLASRLAAKNMRWLGRSGCEDVAGCASGFWGVYDEAAYDEAAPDDRSDGPHYTCDDVQACVEINQCVGTTGEDLRITTPSSAPMAWGRRDDSANVP